MFKLEKYGMVLAIMDNNMKRHQCSVITAKITVPFEEGEIWYYQLMIWENLSIKENQQLRRIKEALTIKI